MTKAKLAQKNNQLSPKEKRSRTRYSSIRKEYKKLTDEQHLDSDYVCAKLGKKHHVDKNTIWQMVRRIGYYKNR